LSNKKFYFTSLAFYLFNLFFILGYFVFILANRLDRSAKFFDKLSFNI